MNKILFRVDSMNSVFGYQLVDYFYEDLNILLKSSSILETCDIIVNSYIP